MASHDTELYLGLFGGIAGLIGSVVGVVFNGVFGNLLSALQTSAGNAVGAIQTQNATSILVHQGLVGILCSLIGIVGALMVNYNAKRGALMLLIAATVGFISANIYFYLGGICLGLAGLMILFKREDTPDIHY